MSEWMWNLITWGGGGVLLLLLAIWGHLTFWAWYYRQREVCGTLSWIYSDDGWRIALEHIPARRGVPARGQVICCPGLACNGRVFHLREGLSMARALSEEGWSVWIFHPRGTGPSEHPEGDRQPYGYREYVADALAVVDFVQARADLPLMWVGHSLGGLVGLDVALRKPQAFDALVTLGTPIALSQHTIGPLHYSIFKWFCRGLKTAYLGKISTLVAPWSGWLPSLHPAPLYVNFDLIDKADLRTALAQCFDDTPRQVLDEFVDAIEREAGPWDRIKDELARLNVPLLAIMGGRDALAPLEVTTPISDVGPHGQTECYQLEAYGHLELVLSAGVELEVIPKIMSWWSEVRAASVVRSSAESSATLSLHSASPHSSLSDDDIRPETEERAQIQSMISPNAG